MIITVKPHSVVDIITNSSSEIFTCDYGHSYQTVYDIVSTLYRLYHRDVGDQWGPSVEQQEDGTIRIEIEFYTVPFDMIELLREIFETHETT